MDTPALLVAAAMVAIGAIAMLLALAVAGLQWQAGPGTIEQPEWEPESALPVMAGAMPDRPARPKPGKRTPPRNGRSASAPRATPALGARPLRSTPPAPAVLPTASALPMPSVLVDLNAAPLPNAEPLPSAVALPSAELLTGAVPLTRTARLARLWIPGPRRATRARQADPALSPGSAALQRHKLRLGAYAVAAAERATQARADADEAMRAAARAEAARDEAWRVLEAADAAPPAAPVPSQRAPVDPTVTQAAFAAFRRGDLTVEELRRVWAQPQDSDPEAARREREQRQRLALSRAARHAYEQAAASARLAREQATVAEVAAEALAGEAAEAAREAAGLSSV